MAKVSPIPRMLISRDGFLRRAYHSRPVGALHQAALGGQLGDPLGEIGAVEGRVGRAEGQLGRGRHQVVREDAAVPRVDHRRLGIAGEEIARVAHEVLIQGVGQGNEDDQRLLAGPPDAAAPLPGAGDAAGIADQKTRIQSPDVDPQLQGRGRDDAQQLPVEQPALDGAPLLRAVPRAVGADPVPQVRRRLVGPHGDQLGDLPRLGEGDGLEPALDAVEEEVGRLAVGAPGGVHEDEALAPGRGAVVVDLGEIARGERAGELGRVADRGRAGDEARVAAVEGRHAMQPAQDVGDVGAEDPLYRCAVRPGRSQRSRSQKVFQAA